ncbi:MAG: 30S ribosomal protein S12 methylthiotransferase RimO [Bacillota bacterium]|nr:30S ribosomal protein S12 methylthiotransferase RimO [Bacillota bacterium]
MEDRYETQGAGPRVAVASLGCAKNLVDTELILGKLGEAGYTLTDQAGEAEVLIVNTCGFIQAAKEESLETVLSLAEQKGHGRCRALVLAGCLAQRYGDTLFRELPEVDAVVGTGEYARLPEIVARALAGERVLAVGAAGYLPEEGPRLVTTGPASAYVKIAEGCSHGCAFCAIPRMRGGYRSRSEESVAKEAEALVAGGVREITLVAQDTTAYGRDRCGEFKLPELLRRLARLEGLVWLRFLYGHPAHLTPDLLGVMAEEEKVVKYLDLPLQHASAAVLRGMRRAGNGEEYLSLLERARAAVPGLVVRSTFIVGFPGETDEAFAELLDFLRRARLDHAGFFVYSPEEGTPAARLRGRVPREVAEERLRRAIRVQQAISATCQRARRGRRDLVLVEKVGRRTVEGRTTREAPEVDGRVVLRGRAPVGTFVWGRIERTTAYDAFGVLEEVAR